MTSTLMSVHGQGSKIDNRVSMFNLQSGLGLSYLFIDPFDEGMHLGMNYKLAFLYNTRSNKLSYGPIYENKSFSKKYSEEIKNKLKLNSFGLRTNINLFQSTKHNLKLDNYFSLRYTFVKDKISATNSNGTDTSERLVFNGQSMSIDIGYKLNIGVAFFDVGFELLNTEVFGTDNSGDPNEAVKLGFNNFQIGIGLEIPIKYIDHKYIPKNM